MAKEMTKETQADTRPPIVVLRDRLMQREGELRAALTDVSPEVFIRAVITSASLNSDILACSWQSIWNSCLKACRDGLIPDGIDGALVPYKGIVNWIPMYQGLLRRFRRSGKFKWVTANIVRSGEVFEHYIDQDGEHFKHIPGDNIASAIVKVYACATTKDGGIFIAVLPIDEANKIRAMSKATRDDSPWRLWPEEMYKKTALRRLSKVLPSARDYMDEPEEHEQTAAPIETQHLPRITSPKQALDHFAGNTIEHQEPEQPEPEPPPKTEQKRDEPPPPDEGDEGPIGVAYRLGREARAAGAQRRAVPPEYRDPSRQREAIAWQAGHDGAPVPSWDDQQGG